MIILNEKNTEANFDISNIDANQIETINVLKGQKAIEKYGREAENGVIEIITKKNVDLLKSSSTKAKKETELDKSEIENTGNETVLAKEQWFETYKAIWKARFSLEKMKVKKEQAKVELEKARVALKSKLFS